MSRGFILLSTSRKGQEVLVKGDAVSAVISEGNAVRIVLEGGLVFKALDGKGSVFEEILRALLAGGEQTVRKVLVDELTLD